MSELTSGNQKYNIKKIDKETVIINIYENDILASIIGEFNENLKKLEKLTSTNIFFRGNTITVKGKLINIEKVSQAIKFLVDKFILTKVIEKTDIVSICIKLFCFIKYINSDFENHRKFFGKRRVFLVSNK